jgi:hypothetical protein
MKVEQEITTTGAQAADDANVCVAAVVPPSPTQSVTIAMPPPSSSSCSSTDLDPPDPPPTEDYFDKLQAPWCTERNRNSLLEHFSTRRTAVAAPLCLV